MSSAPRLGKGLFSCLLKLVYSDRKGLYSQGRQRQTWSPVDGVLDALNDVDGDLHGDPLFCLRCAVDLWCLFHDSGIPVLLGSKLVVVWVAFGIEFLGHANSYLSLRWWRLKCCHFQQIKYRGSLRGDDILAKYLRKLVD